MERGARGRGDIGVGRGERDRRGGREGKGRKGENLAPKGFVRFAP